MRSKVISYIAEGKTACAGKLPFIKLLNLMRLIHCHKNGMGETTLMIQLYPPGIALVIIRIITIDGKIWAGIHTAKPYQTARGSSSI